MSIFLEQATRAALEAGAILRDKVGKVQVREKGPADLVTEADVESQRCVESILLTAFPDHYFLGEESQGKTPSFGTVAQGAPLSKKMLSEMQCGSKAPADLPYTWIVDPLDGTTNFVHGVPFFCTSIALCRGNDVLCAVIYNPNNDELFTAEKGQGAFLNGRRIHTSDAVRPADALTSVSFPTRTRFDSPDYLSFLHCATVCQAMRRTGSTALNLAYVACGRFDCNVCQCAHPWDVAAGILLILEAGGLATHVDGGPYDLAVKPLLVTANSELHRGFLTLLNE